MTDGRTEKRNRIEYWLELINNYGKHSKIYIVVNVRDEQRLSINRQKLIEKYRDNDIEIVEFSVGFDKLQLQNEQRKNKEAFDRFRSQIARYITKSPAWDSRIISVPLFEIKKQIDLLFENGKEHITYDEYMETALAVLKDYPIETENGEDDRPQKYLSKFLHNLGICFYYDKLKGFDKLVLNPVWITNGIYAIIKYLNNVEQYSLKLTDFGSALNSKGLVKRYNAEDYNYLYHLMLEFNLAYEIEETKTLVIPSCMPLEQPKKNKMPVFEVGKTFVMNFVAETQFSTRLFIPADVMPQFIVRFNRDIYNNLTWREGVVLRSQSGAIAKITVDEQVIKVEVKLTDNNGYVQYIREELLQILGKYENFKNQTIVKIALIDEDGKVSEELVGYDEVQRLWKAKIEKYDNPMTGKIIFVDNNVKAYG
jgi:internalin A